jgi:5-methylcytosine-specific restriction endonuclease McrA
MENILDTRVLLINKFDYPVAIITVKEALLKLFSMKAEVVYVDDGSFCNYDINSWMELSEMKREFNEVIGNEEWLFSPSKVIQVPRIIKERTHTKHVLSKKIRFSRRNVCIRDGYSCQYCGTQLNTKDIQLEHVIPVSKGGKTEWTNIVCSCHKCNSKKRDRTPAEADMKLLRKPFEPRYNFSLRLGNDERYMSWKSFISEVYWNTELK